MGSLGAIDSVVCISSWLLGHIHIHNTYTIDNPLLWLLPSKLDP